jgi:hypothetical protein
MAFCNNCGNQLKGTERFCAACGADVSAKTSSASTPSVTPAPPPSAPPTPAPAAAGSGSFAAAPPPPVHPGAPVVYPQGGPTPIPVAYVPPQAPAAGQNKGLMGTAFIVIVAAAIGWYFYNKAHTTNPPTTNTPPASQPGAPTNSPPPSTGGNGGNTALIQQQQLDAQWQASAGFIMVTAKWTNSSTVNLATAVMECDQYDANGTDLSQFRVTLNGPTPANTWSSYSNVKMGAVANGMTKLACRIAHVTPTS